MNRISLKDYEKKPVVPKSTTEEKCWLCINCDVDGTCIAKREAPFGSFECEKQ